MFYFQHLQRSRLLDDRGLVHQFFLDHLLHWIEALGRMKMTSEGVATLQILKPMVSHYQNTFETLDSLPLRLVKVLSFMRLLKTPADSSLTVSQLLNKSHYKPIPLLSYLRRIRA
jgi:hypothetical protein